MMIVRRKSLQSPVRRKSLRRKSLQPLDPLQSLRSLLGHSSSRRRKAGD